MRNVAASMFAACLIAACAGNAFSDEAASRGLRPERSRDRREFEQQIYQSGESPAGGYYINVRYDFEGMNWQGWKRIGADDRTLGLVSRLAYADPCDANLSTRVDFFLASQPPRLIPWTRFGNPFLPGLNGFADPSRDAMIVSPVIDLDKYSMRRDAAQDTDIPSGTASRLGGYRLRFTVYSNLPAGDGLFYIWRIRNIENSRPGPWLDRDLVYYGSNTSSQIILQDISDLVTGREVQVALGVVDMGDVRHATIGSAVRHTPSLWFDDIQVERYLKEGPAWSVRDIDLFQDNFPSREDDIESHVRADAAIDISRRDDPSIRPGDSIVVTCASPLGGGIAMENGRPAVYLHVSCTWIGGLPAKQDLLGSILEGTYGRYVSDNGFWTIIQGDLARAGAGAAHNKYIFDLNDSLFTRGYAIRYYFSARDNAGNTTTLPEGCPYCFPPMYFEFTCLPTGKSDILFVDDSGVRGPFYGGDDFWSPVFEAVIPPNNQPDRYDVNGPSSGASNGPGGRARSKQLAGAYKKIIWDCGDMESFTITDGSKGIDKSDDCKLLVDWTKPAEHVCGLWVCGNGVASDLQSRVSPSARDLMNAMCGVEILSSSYIGLTGIGAGGGDVGPLVTGDSDAGIFMHAGVPDRFYVANACPFAKRFDVLDKTMEGEYALRYPDQGGRQHHAAIAALNLNRMGFIINTMWFGFGFQYVRDDAPALAIDRYELAKDVLWWLENTTNIEPTLGMARPLPAYGLSQNFPNPFNPSTTIRFDMKERGLVTLKIFDVSGRLVRTLADEVRDAGAYSAVWDGRNNGGMQVASGIYFYKMETAGFQATKKLVLLR